MDRITSLWSDLREIIDLPSSLGFSLTLVCLIELIKSSETENPLPSVPAINPLMFIFVGSLLLLFAVLITEQVRPGFFSLKVLTMGGMIIGSIGLLLINPQMKSLYPSQILSVVGLLCAGVGLGLLLLLWATVQSPLALRRRVATTVSSAIIACLIDLILFVFPFWLFSLLLLPLFIVSSFLLLGAIDTYSGERYLSEPKKPYEPLALRSIWAKSNRTLVLSAIVYGFLFVLPYTLASSDQRISAWPTIALIAANCLLTGAMMRYSRKEDSDMAYRFGIPFLGVGLATLPILEEGLGIVSFSFIHVGTVLFFIFFLIVLGNIHQSFSVSPIRANASGLFFASFGMFLSCLVEALCSTMQVPHRTIITWFSLAGLLMLVIVLWLMSRGEYFSNYRTPFEDSEPDDESTALQKWKSYLEASGLTLREIEVAVLLVKGRNISYICDKLYIARSTVQTHTKHIYAKLGVGGKQEIIDLFETQSKIS